MEFWKMAYKYKWATIDQLKQVVAYGQLTPEQYKEITGETYVDGTTTPTGK